LELGLWVAGWYWLPGVELWVAAWCGTRVLWMWVCRTRLRVVWMLLWVTLLGVTRLLWVWLLRVLRWALPKCGLRLGVPRVLPGHWLPRVAWLLLRILWVLLLLR